MSNLSFSKSRVVLGAAIVGVAVVAVVVALAVVAAARPSDAELRREVAADLGVPDAILELPLVERALDRVGTRAESSVVEQLDTSLALGGLAGVVSAALLAAVVVRRTDGHRA
jgi:hypothetical protein